MEVQIIFAILAVLFVISLLLLSKFKMGGGSEWKLAVNQHLLELTQRIQSNDVHVIKSALIDMDKLLDHTMKKRGIKGESMGERLKNAEKYYDRNFYNRLWEAHKMRNRVVHEVGNAENNSKIKDAFSTLKQGINRLI